MAVQSATEKRVLCPSCGTKGKRVSPVTMRAVLKHEYAEVIAAPEHSFCDFKGNGESGCKPITGDTGWRFCDSQVCDVVYFAEYNEATFTKSQLRVPVGVKENTGERPLCYCFGHSVASIKDEVRVKGRSDALEGIRQKMEDPGCHCETSNPSGSCCLGSVAKGIETATQELAIVESDKQHPPSKSPSNRGEKIAKIGTVISAIVASSCCWLPLLLLAVGVSGAGIASTLEAYRPLFIVLTFGFLAAAFYFTYRPRKSQADCCSTVHNCCAAPSEGPKRRFSMMTLNKAMLWVVTLVALLVLFFPKYVGFFLASREAASEASAENLLVTKTTIAIDGMTCEGCAVVLESRLKNVPGVLNAKVDYTNKQAVVSTESCCPFPKDEILKAVRWASNRLNQDHSAMSN